MTRLEENWISNMANEMTAAELDLKNKTGLNYRQLAAKAAGIEDADFDELTKSLKVAVVTITTGLGVIGSFAGSVKGILESMKINTFVTENSDVDGIFEAHLKGADIVFMADDDRFIALNLKNSRIGENNIGTAKGFVTALEAATGKSPLKDIEVLVIGCGTVGKLMIDEVLKKGGIPVCWDIDASVLEDLKKQNLIIINSIDNIKEYKYVLDASSQGNWMDIGMLHPDSWYVSPGVPLSLTKEALAAHKNQTVHDLLPIGVVTMLALAL